MSHLIICVSFLESDSRSLTDSSISVTVSEIEGFITFLFIWDHFTCDPSESLKVVSSPRTFVNGLDGNSDLAHFMHMLKLHFGQCLGSF